MPVVRIDGPADPRVADYRNISEPTLVRVRGLFVAEGRLSPARDRGRALRRSLSTVSEARQDPGHDTRGIRRIPSLCVRIGRISG